MKTRVTLQLLEQIAQFDLRFTCEECAHFTGTGCAHGWPGGERKRALLDGEEIEFCKEFEAC